MSIRRQEFQHAVTSLLFICNCQIQKSNKQKIGKNMATKAIKKTVEFNQYNFLKL